MTFIQTNLLFSSFRWIGAVSVYAGSGEVGSRDGPRLTASFTKPRAITRDDHGNLFICDRGIRKITPDGMHSSPVSLMISSPFSLNNNGI
jgi:sugar lactone lactonase YvrE